MNGDWYTYQLYNHLKHFWRNSIVDRLNRHGIHWIQFPDTRIHHYGGKPVMNVIETNEEIARKIISGKPFMVSRLGGCEMKYTESYLEGHRSKRNFDKALRELCFNAGFFPNQTDAADQFAQRYLEDMKQIDLDGVWRFFMEDYLVKHYLPNAQLTILEYLEPWRAPEGVRPWSYALAGKKVLVVHPFEETIKKQYTNNRTKLFANVYDSEDILPQFELTTIKAVQSIGGKGAAGYATWFDALSAMTDQIRKTEFDVAIVGCGAYGLPLAAEIKRMGKQAIHLGGATQLMFGIRGGRWDNTPAISKLKNDAWVTASQQEKPKYADKVENGCYW